MKLETQNSIGATKNNVTLETAEIVEWAMRNDPDLSLYRTVQNFRPPNDWCGTSPGKNGGVIYLIAQTDSSAIYGETTNDLQTADLLVGGDFNLSPAAVAVREILDLALGDQSGWPDNYAQSMGWEIRDRRIPV